MNKKNLRFDLFANFSAMLMDRILSMVTSCVLTPVLTRYLETAQYGDYALAIAHTLLFLPFASWGVDLLCLREIAHRPHQASAVLGHALTLRILLSSLTYAMTVSCALFLKYPPPVVLGIGLYAITLLASPLELGNLVFQSNIQFQRIAGISSLSNLGLLFTLLRGIHAGWGIVWLLTASAGFNILRSAIVFLLAQRITRIRPSWDKLHALSLLAQATPIALSSLLFTITTRLDIIMLSKFRGPEAVALYAAPYAVFSALSFVPQGLATTFFPLIAQTYPSDPARTQRWFYSTLLYSWVVAFPLGIGGMVVAEQLVSFLFGPRFGAASAPFQILSVAQLFVFGSPLLGFMILAVGAQRQNLWLGVWMSLGSLLGNLLLIPRLGSAGAALTSLLVSAATFIFALRIVCSFIPLTAPIRQLWRVVIPCATMALVLSLMPPTYVLAKVLIGAAVYAFVLALCSDGFRALRPANLVRSP